MVSLSMGESPSDNVDACRKDRWSSVVHLAFTRARQVHEIRNVYRQGTQSGSEAYGRQLGSPLRQATGGVAMPQGMTPTRGPGHGRRGTVRGCAARQGTTELLRYNVRAGRELGC